MVTCHVFSGFEDDDEDVEDDEESDEDEDDENSDTEESDNNKASQQVQLKAKSQFYQGKAILQVRTHMYLFSPPPGLQRGTCGADFGDLPQTETD